MDTTTQQRIQDLIAQHESIGVAIGKTHTVDEMGAALGLYLFLSSMQKKVSIATPLDPLVEVSSLVGINKVKTSLAGEGGDLVVSFPYKDNEIQKVSYTLEEGFLNIVVKAGENGLTFTEQDVQYTRGGGAPTLLFIVGTPRIADLGELFNSELLKDTIIVNIDNKIDNQGFGDVVLVSQNYSSVSEQVAQLLSYLNPNFDIDIAQNLLSGISFATENFQNSKASYMAFEMAATLMRKGAVRLSPQPSWTEEQSRPFQPQQSRPQQQPRQQQQPRRDQRPQQLGQNQSGNQQPKKDFSGQKQEDQKQKPEEEKNPAPDWLTPKVYRGPTTV